MSDEYYLNEFKEAQLRTQRFSLSSPAFEYTTNRFLTSEKMQHLPYVVRDAIGEPDIKEIIARCFSIHWQLLEPLSAHFGAPLVYTIGYIHTPPEYRFKQTEEQLLKMLQQGIFTSEISLHAWLTFPSMEILDFTLITSMISVNGWDKQNLGGVIASHADELDHQLRFHPMLLGDEFMWKIGAIQEAGTRVIFI